jgi:hypothetical protein
MRAGGPRLDRANFARMSSDISARPKQIDAALFLGMLTL